MMFKCSDSTEIKIPHLFDRANTIALLLTPKLASHCKIMRGFSERLKNNRDDWMVVLNHELRFRHKDVVDLWFDGIIADYNNQQQREYLEKIDAPVIGLISGIDNLNKEFKHPIISIDNQKVVTLAYEHLIEKGHTHIAYYGLHDDEETFWSDHRESTYRWLQSEREEKPLIYHGNQASFSSWMEETEALRMWVNALPKPCGIIVSSDIRARTLVGVCEANNTVIPDEVSIVSIGDIAVSEFFHQNSLTFVDPNHSQMGDLAAQLMKQLLSGNNVPKISYSCPGVVEQRSSSDYRSVHDQFVLRALHYVRMNACKGIKVQQVVDYAGCSRTMLESRFKDQVGHSIHHEIHELKIKMAKKILIETNLPVKDVAVQSGFSSYQYLYGLFQKELGMTPSDYRADNVNI